MRDPFSDDRPDFQEVIDALDDPGCREIMKAADEPMTANQLSEECGIPTSTIYRKLDLLDRTSLLSESTRIRKDGKHTSRYTAAFESIVIRITEDREFEAEVTRPSPTTEQRLADMWTTVREQT